MQMPDLGADLGVGAQYRLTGVVRDEPGRPDYKAVLPFIYRTVAFVLAQFVVVHVAGRYP